MAKVIGPLHSSEARGRMGGLIFNSHRGMAVVKAKHAPCQPRSQLQMAARSLAVSLARAWANNTEQAAWNYYASTHPYNDGMGVAIRATGENWFIALNSRLLAAGESAITDPPSVAAPGEVTGLVLTPSAGEISCAWVDPGASDDTVQFWLDGPRTKGRASSLPRAKYNTSAAGNTSPAVISDLQPGRYTVWARSFSKVTGLVGPWAVSTCDVT